MKVWVILPAYNEEKALPMVLNSLIAHLTHEALCYEIVVVDDGSSDDTEKIAQSYAGRTRVSVIHHARNRGLGEAIRRGFFEVLPRAQVEDVIITMDADNTHPPEVIHSMLAEIEKGSDMVIASRYRYRSRTCGVPFTRMILSKVASWTFRLFFGMRGVRDYTCGYRAYRAGLIAKMMERRGRGFISETGFACMVEIIFNISEEKVRISEVPLILRYDLKRGASKIRIFKTIRDTLRLLILRRLKVFLSTTRH